MIKILSVLAMIGSLFSHPITLKGKATQISSNGTYYERVYKDPSFLPATLITSDWIRLQAQSGQSSLSKVRPAAIQVSAVCPGRTLHCIPKEIYIELALEVYDIEYQNHSLDMTICGRMFCINPFTGVNISEKMEGKTNDLPKNWIPGSKDSPQLHVVKYFVGGEFDIAKYSDITTNSSTGIILGEWRLYPGPDVPNRLHCLSDQLKDLLQGVEDGVKRDRADFRIRK